MESRHANSEHLQLSSVQAEKIFLKSARTTWSRGRIFRHHSLSFVMSAFNGRWSKRLQPYDLTDWRRRKFVFMNQYETLLKLFLKLSKELACLLLLCTSKREVWVFASSSGVSPFTPRSRQRQAPLLVSQLARSRSNNNKQALNVLG